MGINSSQRGNKKKLGYFLIETKPLIFATTRRRVCCVYVKARIVYVSEPFVYVKTDRFPFVYRHYRHFACMFARFHYSFFTL